MNLFLKEPTLEDKVEVLQMFKELIDCVDEYPFEGAGRLNKLADKSYEEWLEDCATDKIIETINPKYVNATNYLLVDENNHVYGYSQLRHSLKDELINIGGNIGYIIRPSERGKGLATVQLQLLIEKAKELGLDKVLVTCRENNLSSKRVIEKCFGEADEPVPSKYPDIMELRYWIDTKKVEIKKVL